MLAEFNNIIIIVPLLYTGRVVALPYIILANIKAILLKRSIL